MKRYYISFALIAIILINSGCPKPCIEASYSFAVNMQISPDLDSVHVGDTIFLLSYFPTQLTDQTSQQVIDYKNSSIIGSNLNILKLLPNDTISKDAVTDFDYVSVIGQIYNDKSIPDPGGVQQIKFEELGNQYSLKVGIVPKAKGNYIFSIADGVGYGSKKNNSCEKASFNFSITNTNQHFYLINEWIPGNKLDNNGKRHVYYFKVY